jgi:chemotaxis-related protein WspB
MLMLLFQAGANRYALDTQQVVEVLPWATLHPLPHAQPPIAGLLNYHSDLISVLDLGQLIERTPCRAHFGSRIILLNAQTVSIPGFETAKWVGLLADRVVDSLHVNPTVFKPLRSQPEQATSYLGDAIVQDQEIIRCFHPERLVLTSNDSALQNLAENEATFSNSTLSNSTLSNSTLSNSTQNYVAV